MESKECRENESRSERSHHPDRGGPLAAKSGRVRVYNDWGAELSGVVVRHRIGNEQAGETNLVWPTVWPGDTTEWQNFTYDSSHRNYWWISFVVIDTREQWACADNFYCSLTSSDNGDVEISLNGYRKDLLVEFSNSSSCTKSLSRVGFRGGDGDGVPECRTSSVNLSLTTEGDWRGGDIHLFTRGEETS
jgi:hypothetical protein